VDQLRHDIDRGRTGDKVDFPDPAAAPLGTDAEAAGRPPSAAEISAELASNGPTIPRQPRISGVAVYAIAAAAVSAGVLAAVVAGTG
jgi:hypothetical protein